MLRSEDGVGGFFEDFPVLALVLLGVFVLVSSSILAARDISQREEEDRLDSVAEGIISAITAHLTVGDAVNYMPTVAGIRQMDLLALVDSVADGSSACASMTLLHPRTEWLCSAATGDLDLAVQTGYSERFLNALLDDGSIAAVGVKVLAW